MARERPLWSVQVWRIAVKGNSATARRLARRLQPVLPPAVVPPDLLILYGHESNDRLRSRSDRHRHTSW